MNTDYAFSAFAVLLLASLTSVAVWSLGFAVYLNRVRSHGWASTRRLLQSLTVAAPLSLLLCGLFWEKALLPTWILASLGRPSSQVELARRYATGDHLLAQNRECSRQWLTRAARLGNGQAELILAGMDWEGLGHRKPDPASALGWARLAAVQGSDEARLVAGEILLNQPTLASPGEKAQAYFDAALPQLRTQAAGGSPEALFSLGMLTVTGSGLAADPEGGMHMLLQAQAAGLDPRQSIRVDLMRRRLPADLVRRAEAQIRPALPRTGK